MAVEHRFFFSCSSLLEMFPNTANLRQRCTFSVIARGGCLPSLLLLLPRLQPTDLLFCPHESHFPFPS